jgi:hypothetical protein
VAQTTTRMNTMLLRGTLAVFLGLGTGALAISLKEALARREPVGSLGFWLLLAHAALIGVALLSATAVWRQKKWGLATLVAAALVLFNVDVFAQSLSPGAACLILLLPPGLVALAAWPNWSEFN